MTELKPCPFCGGKADYWNNIDLEPVGVICKQCKMTVRFMRVKPPKLHEPYGKVMEKIAEAWNRRTE